MTGHAAVIAAYTLGLCLLLGYGAHIWLSARALRRRSRGRPE